MAPGAPPFRPDMASRVAFGTAEVGPATSSTWVSTKELSLSVTTQPEMVTFAPFKASLSVLTSEGVVRPRPRARVVVRNVLMGLLSLFGTRRNGAHGATRRAPCGPLSKTRARRAPDRGFL